MVMRKRTHKDKIRWVHAADRLGEYVCTYYGWRLYRCGRKREDLMWKAVFRNLMFEAYNDIYELYFHIDMYRMNARMKKREKRYEVKYNARQLLRDTGQLDLFVKLKK